MSTTAAKPDPRARDRLLQHTRAIGRVFGVLAAGLTAVLSVVAAHAFKGHDGRKASAAAASTASAAVRTAAATTAGGVRVPPPDPVPSISGAPAPIQPPPSPPAADSSSSASAAAPPATAVQVPVEPVAPPVTSGGS